jgi:thiol-disulfide isomerase/thioredoxin
VHFAYKSFSMEDTLLTKAMIEMVSNPNDTIFGGFVFIETEEKAYAYTGEASFFGDKASSTLTINDIKDNPGGSVKHDWVDNFVESSFLTKNQSGRTAVTNPEFRPAVSDTMIGQWPCLGVLLTLPDQEGVTDFKVFVAYDTIDYMLRHRSISLVFQENEQYQSWDYFNPEFGHQKELTKLNDDFLSSFKHQKLYEYIPRDFSDTPISPIDYSTLKGRIMGSEKAFDIQQLDEQIIILDFWYSSCYPCIQSIPEVNKIYDRFHDKGVVIFGVNIIDDEIKNISRIEKYVRNNPMKYQTVMADPQKYTTWVPNGYPMLLILDSNFQLIETHGGYSEAMADDISKIIEEHLDR